MGYVLDGDDVQFADGRGLGGVVGGDEEGRDALVPGHGRDGEDAVDVAHGAIEGELADDEGVLNRLGPHLL